MSLLTQTEREKIEAAIARVEATSSAEIVVAALVRSGRYPALRLLAACISGFASALLWLRLEPWYPPELAIAIGVVVTALAYLLLGLRPFERWTIWPESAERAVELQAYRLFVERGLHKTRDHTGVLLLVSELEHRAIILGDSGIHAHIGHERWREHIDLLVDRIRRGVAAEGIVELLERIGKVLEEHFPVRPDDTDELPNRVIEHE